MLHRDALSVTMFIKTPFIRVFSVCSFKLSCHWCPPLVPSIAHGACLCQAVLREAGKNSTWRLPGNGVGDAKHTPGVGAGGNPVRIRTCVFLTVPAPRSPLVLWGYYWGNILPWDSLGLRPAIQSVRYAFAQAVRLSTVLWEFISEGKAKAKGQY